MTVSRIILVVLPLAVALVLIDLADAQEARPYGAGELRIIAPDGEPTGICPLRHTDVRADVTGIVSRVRVRQEFYNPLDHKIEAVYVFPLPQHAAVDDMTMTVGDRRIVGLIKPRDQARRIYEDARAAGHVTSLLDQERPNIFTQSVANIEPGVEVVIEISFVDILNYREGLFEFTFPMVVGPRYIPGGGSAPAPMTIGRPTPQVPDGHRITPPVTPPGTRAGHDISLTVNIDAGSKIAELSSAVHRVNVERPADARAVVTLASRAEIPNRDFILRYSTAGAGLADALFTHTDPRGTFFTMLLQPPKRIVPREVVPRELIFVLDTSGSMNGFPIEKAKQVMTHAIDAMRPRDTFNLITFAGSTRILWTQPRPNTRRNRDDAKQFLALHRGGGGTEMMKAINAALIQASRGLQSARTEVRSSSGLVGCRRRPEGEPSIPTDEMPSGGPMRIVCFLTDGYVGNDAAIIDAVKRNAGTTRVFSFGIGNAVNRFLLDGMAAAGRGEVEYVTLNADADAAVARFCERIAAPVLADIRIDWGSLQVDETYPRHIPDLFSTRPIMIHGRLQGTPAGTVTLKGRTGVGPFERTFEVTPATVSHEHDALASLWARAKIDDLMTRDDAFHPSRDGQGAVRRPRGTTSPDTLRDRVTTLAVDYRLMTRFTSFVAVEEMRVTEGGQLTTINVPVEMPDGVNYQGVFGTRDAAAPLASRGLQSARKRQSHVHGFAGRPSSANPPAASTAPSGIRGALSRWLRPNVSTTFTEISAPLPSGSPAGEGGASSSSIGRGRSEAVLDAVNEPAQPQRRELRTPWPKLAAVLRGLAAKVAADGVDGNLTLGTLRVVDYKVTVRLYLRDTSEDTLKTLRALGFVMQAESKTVHMIVGTIDVRRLADLENVDVVVRVAPILDE